MNYSTKLLLIPILFSVQLSMAQKAKGPKSTESAPTFSVPARLEQELMRLSNLSGGKVGICATHIESGKTITQNGKEPFPMASSYKVAIATQLLTRVDSGSLNLDQLVTLTKDDLHPGSGMLSG